MTPPPDSGAALRELDEHLVGLLECDLDTTMANVGYVIRHMRHIVKTALAPAPTSGEPQGYIQQRVSRATKWASENPMLASEYGLDTAANLAYATITHPAPSTPAPQPPQALEALAIADREARPWNYYRLDHDTLTRMLNQMADKLAALSASPAEPPRPNRFDCHECKTLGVAVDEDGCCRTCGSDAAIMLSAHPIPAAPVEPPITHARLKDFARQARKVWNGFRNESLNGVVCSIPDEGLDAVPHRTWCRQCQKHYRGLLGLVDQLEQAALHAAPAPAERTCATCLNHGQCRIQAIADIVFGHASQPPPFSCSLHTEPPAPSPRSDDAL